MTAVTAWALAHVRRRLVMLVALGLLTSIAGAATLTAIAGARRTASSYERHLEATSAPHVIVTSGLDPEFWKPGVLDPIAEIEGVETWSEAVSLAMRPVGTDFFFLFDRWVFGAVDDRLGTDTNRFRIVEGRAYDHGREDEAVITPEYAEAVGVGVGDVIHFESWTARAVVDALLDNFAFSASDGPMVDVTVVGITREINPLWVDGAGGTVFLTEAFTRRWGDEIGAGPPVGLVRLEDAAAGVSSFETNVRSVSEQLGPEYLSWQPTAQTAQIAGGIDAQIWALLVFALLAGVAGMVVTFAALARQLSFASEDQPALSAIGMTRAQRVAGVVMLGVPTALVAAAASAAIALPASALLPIGTPGLVEPDPGVRADPLVLVGGAIAVAVIVLILSSAAGVSLTRLSTSHATVTRPGAGISVARWVRSSAPISIGVRTALDRGRGPRALPTRSTLAGCAVGVGGMVAALAFAASLNHLTSTPRLYGWTADAVVGVGGGVEGWQQLARQLESNPDIDEVATIIAAQLFIDEQSVGGIVFDPRRGDPLNVVISGRAPQARNEVAMGRAVADQLGVGPGDTVSVKLSDETVSRYTVVGIAAHMDSSGGYRDQVALIGDSIEPFLSFDEALFYGVLVTFRDGVETGAALSSLRDEGLNPFVTDQAPRSVANLEEVGVFPVVLAGLLGVLGAAFLLHALAVAARRRGHELAVLKALGFSRRQLRTVALSQATTIAVVSLVVGVPLGLGIGRTAWATLADQLGVATEHSLPGSPVLWVAAVIGAANLMGLLVARSAIHVRPAAELHSGRQD